MPTTSPTNEPLLLDTHIWIWLEEAAAREIGPKLTTILRRASADDALRVSVLSVWEIAMLEMRKRITLSLAGPAWIERALEAPGLRVQEFSPAIAVESTRLPGQPHRDPVDRILIATARLTGATLVTRDARILKYARVGHVRALDANPSS